MVFDNFMDDEIFTRSSSLAYYMALTMAPLVILIVWLVSLLNLDLQAAMVNDVAILIGTDAAKLVETIVHGANERPDLSSLSGWLGLAGILISGSIVFGELQTTLEKIFDTPLESTKDQTNLEWVKSYLFGRIFSIGMLLTFVFIAIVSLIVSSIMSFYLRSSTAIVFHVINFIANYMVFAFLFAMIYKWLPRQRISFRSGMVAGMITSFLFIVGKTGIGMYLGRAAVGSAYGAAGSVVVLLVWVFYSAIIFFFGAEVSHVFVLRDEHSKLKGAYAGKTKSEIQKEIGAAHLGHA